MSGPGARRVVPSSLESSFGLEAPGIPIGDRPDGRPLRLPLLADEQVRVAVLDLPELLRLMALRLLGAGCELTVVTADPRSWAGVQRAGGNPPVLVTPGLTRWPLEGSVAPRALVVDMPEPPRPEFARHRWTTVVHGATRASLRSPWWLGAQVLLARPGSGRTVAALSPSTDAASVREIDLLSPPDFAAVVRGRLHVARWAPTARETAALG
ncbi:hypothetical protein GB931_03595 [Modestobacter sp. I12A-02628]|uniref:Uncharacterized protein n=1 Tax=Goekera deserti TaxID=2497753 RepID=A0A7K3WCM6_9ACTN|nr:hypothetical protein [Goekera deserti]MPQ97022.1 hypothetical protein [Goekera deserti]NDI46662.1 hypothetical protein [Goekera deserti]NEL54231.1 hypothetical protein [Goekera deserti]